MLHFKWKYQGIYCKLVGSKKFWVKLVNAKFLPQNCVAVRPNINPIIRIAAISVPCDAFIAERLEHRSESALLRCFGNFAVGHVPVFPTSRKSVESYEF